MSFLEKLMLSKQIKFEDGQTEILKQRVIFVPSDFLGEYTFEILREPELVKLIYFTLKQGVNNFGEQIMRTYGSTITDYSKLLRDLSDLAGWGKTTYESLNIEQGSATLIIENSPVSSYLKGRVNLPCDHISRGVIAGIASIALKKDLDVLEIECIATGNKACKMVLDSKDKLKSNFPRFYKMQFGSE